MKFRKNSFYIYFLAILFVFTLFFWTNCQESSSNENKNGKKQEIVLPVKIQAAKSRFIREKIYGVGDIQGVKSVWVYPPIGGKVLNIQMSEGMQIEKDTFLCEIDREYAGFVHAPIYSPIAGVISNVGMVEGDTVTNSTHLCMITQIEWIKIILNVPDNNLGKISEELESAIKVSSFDEVFYGYVNKIYPVMDPLTRTVKVEILFHNNLKKLLPGMFAEVEIFTRKAKQPVMLPISSLIFDESQKLLFVYDPESEKVSMRSIKTGEIEGNDIEILEGIKDGEYIVVDGQFQLFDGDKVKALNKDEVISPKLKPK